MARNLPSESVSDGDHKAITLPHPSESITEAVQSARGSQPTPAYALAPRLCRFSQDYSARRARPLRWRAWAALRLAPGLCLCRLSHGVAAFCWRPPMPLMLGSLVCGPPAAPRRTRCANPQTRCCFCVLPLWAPRRGCGALSVCGRVRLSACGDGWCPGSPVCGAPAGGVPALPVGSLVGVAVCLAPAGGAWPRAPGAAPGVAALSGSGVPWARVGLPAPLVGGAALVPGSSGSVCCAFLRPGAGGPRRPPAGWCVAAVAACAVSAGWLAVAPAADNGARLPGASMIP